MASVGVLLLRVCANLFIAPHRSHRSPLLVLAQRARPKQAGQPDVASSLGRAASKIGRISFDSLSEMC